MRRTVLGVVMAFVSGLGLWSEAWAQTQRPVASFNLYGGGTRAQSMAGAFIGLSDDASAATWNPAGLTQNDRIYTELDWGVSQQKFTNTLESTADLPILYDNTSSQSIAHFNFLAFNGPLTLKGQRFHLAATWNRGAYINYDAQDILDDFTGIPIDVPPGVELQSIQSYRRVQGGPEYATLAMATQLKEEVLSLGFGLNLFLGNETDSSQSVINITEFGVGTRLVSDVVDRQDYSGVNFNFGALYQTGSLSVGLTCKTPFKLEQQHDARDADQVYEVTPDSLLLVTENSVLLDFKSQVEMPLQLGVGLAFRPQENFVLAGDYEYKGFSNSQTYLQEDLLDPKSELVATDPQWKDVHQIRLGAEYQIAVGWGVIPIRAGFRIEPQPYSHQVDVQEPLVDLEGDSRTYSQGDQVTGEVYTLGTGVQWRQIRMDITWELGTSSTYSSGFFSDSFQRPEFIYTRENRTQRLQLGFTGYF